MRTVFAVLLVGVLSIRLLASGAPDAQADHTGGGMQAMSIDMDEEVTPANTDSAVGTRENCRRINENNLMDADEDVTDGLLIDTTAQGVPPVHDSATADPSDDTGGMVGFSYEINYSSANLTVQAEQSDTPGLNMLRRNAGSSLFLISDPTPDDNSDDRWNGTVTDPGVGVPESGDGVLQRVTIITESGAATGNHALTLTTHAHLDAQGFAYTPQNTNNAYVAVNAACGDFDSDGVLDAQDDCPQLPGSAANNGCPPPGPPAVGGTAGLIDAGQDGDSSPADPLVVAGAFAAIGGLAAAVSWRLLKRGAPLR